MWKTPSFVALLVFAAVVLLLALGSFILGIVGLIKAAKGGGKRKTPPHW